MDLDCNKDNVYYEKMFESLFPRLKRFDLKEEIDKCIEELKLIFRKLEIEYEIRYESQLIFHIEKINTYLFDWNISFDLSRLGIQHKDDLKHIVVPNIKYKVLEYWDSKLLA